MLENVNCDYTYMKGNFAYVGTFADSHEGTNYGGYNLLKNNCLNYVIDALNSGGTYRYFSKIIPANFNPKKDRISKTSGKTCVSYSINSSGGGGSVMYCFDKCDPSYLLLNRYRI